MGVVLSIQKVLSDRCTLRLQLGEGDISQDTGGPCPDRGRPQEGPGSNDGFLYHSGTSRHTVALGFRSGLVPLSEFHCASVCPSS